MQRNANVCSTIAVRRVKPICNEGLNLCVSGLDMLQLLENPSSQQHNRCKPRNASLFTTVALSGLAFESAPSYLELTMCKGS